MKGETLLDDFTKRFVIAYLGLTAGLWAISYGMTVNGSARPWNPAWKLISGMRAFFSWGLVLAVGAIALAWLLAGIAASQEAAEKTAKARIEEDQRAKRDAERRQREAIIQAEQMKEQKQKEIERQRLYEERKKQKLIEKQTRSAEDAADKALADF